jgi:hypothetical protein
MRLDADDKRSATAEHLAHADVSMPALSHPAVRRNVVRRGAALSRLRRVPARPEGATRVAVVPGAGAPRRHPHRGPATQ